MQTLPVIFRVHRSCGRNELVAYFPTEPWTRRGGDITCYADVGEHGSACPTWLRRGRRAEPYEYAELLERLQSIYGTEPNPVQLKVYKRATGKASVR